MKKTNQTEQMTKLKDRMKQLIEELQSSYEYVSVLITDSLAKNYAISKTQVILREDVTFGTRGAVIKVQKDGKYTEFSFNDFTEQFLKGIPDKLMQQITQCGQFYKQNKYHTITEQTCMLDKSSEYKISPVEYGDEKIIDRIRKVHQAVLAVDERIFDCNVRFQFQKYTKIFLSKEKEMQQNLMWSAGMIQPLVKKEKETKFYYDTFSGLCGAELLDEMDKSTERIGKVALELIDAQSITPGLYDVICMPDVTGILAHEAFGHGVEMDMFVKDRALAKDYIGKQVASELVTMHDGGIAYPQSGFYYFDDEGQLAKDTIVIEKGILKEGISDLQSAQILGTNPTGNGRRESFERKAYTRMTNTYFEEGQSTLEEMIATIEHGYLLECALSGMEDPKNWGIQCMVNIAREIKDGKLTGVIYSPIVLTGYVPDVLKSISMVSDEKVLSGSGCCGKGYKEWVKVSDGGAAIKAKVQLS